METPEFEWDDEKALSNLKKHDVSFEEAATIFNSSGTFSKEVIAYLLFFVLTSRLGY